MKKAFTLIEVIISISLLSIVIVTILKIKENNFDNIEKLNIINNDAQLLGVASIYNNSKNSKNTHIYLNNILNNTKDSLHKVLKNTKVYIKSEKINSQKIELKVINTIQTSYKIKNKASVDIYTFKIE